MGLSWSKRHHHHHHHHHNHRQNHQQSHQQSHQQLEPPTNSISQPPPPPPPPPPREAASYSFAANSPYLVSAPPPLPPPPPPHPPYYGFNGYNNYERAVVPQPTYHPYFIPPPNLWASFRPPPSLPPPGLRPPPLPDVPYVDHHTSKKIKNDINVRKETLSLLLHPSHPDSHLVSFTFDAMVDGSITVMYFGKEGENCSFTSIYPEIVPVKIPFQKGIGQKFLQPPGNGIDLGFFDIDDLSKTLQGDVFPLVISAESNDPSTSLGMQTDGQVVNTPSHAQITLAILQKNKESQFQVKVLKQILWVDGVRYELKEIYGISSSGEEAVNNQDTDKECVICMTDPKDTTVLPCRHMCLCSSCAKELRLQSNKCPICRQPIQELLEIKIGEGIIPPFA